jgi:hypothetical protein
MKQNEIHWNKPEKANEYKEKLAQIEDSEK